MTADEIKKTYSMQDIASRYGVKVRHDGMCCCPIHGEKHPSMKLYKDSYHCFACGKHGDIFSFIQEMEHCAFKTAFYMLGGEYSDNHRQSAVARYHAQKEKEKRERKERERKRKQFLIDIDLHAYRELAEEAEPDSDEWWEYWEKHYWADILDENMQGGDL